MKGSGRRSHAETVLQQVRNLAHRAALVAVLVALLCPLPAGAVPADPTPRSLAQPDGSTLAARQWGDEWLHGWETLDGFTVVRDASGTWRFAARATDGALIATDRTAGRDLPPEGVGPRLRPSGRAVERAAAMRASAQSVAGATVVAPSGTANVPVVLTTFSDTNPTFAASDFNSLLFGAGTWSMRDYYREVSYGRFSVSAGPGGVVGWYRASNTHDYYGSDNSEGKDMWPGDLVHDAVAAADAAGFNFAPYDSNGDCYVDVVDVVHQGSGAEVTGNPATDIWSHAWTLSSAQYYGRSHYGEYTTRSVCSAGGYVKVNSYVIEPEIYSGGITTMGVFAHEFGHALGLPDLYDTDDSSEGVGRWSLMGGGSWCKVSRGGDRPAHMDPWCKSKLGWVVPKKVTSTLTGQAIAQAATAADVWQLLDGGPVQGGEYFLVENRQQASFDAGLPGAGLLIWHIDEARADNTGECYPGGPACSTQHFKVALVQADNAYEMEKNTNQGDEGDPYPGWSNNRAFGAATGPDSSLFSGQASGVAVTGISDPGPTMTANLAIDGGGSGATVIFADSFESSFPGSWSLFRGDSSATVEWGRSTYRANGGGASAWCAAGGATPQAPGGQYVGGMNTWMIYGPFSLADATDASAEFDLWLESEAYDQATQEGDRFKWFISVNGTNFSGYYTSGSSGGWSHKVLNFKDVTSLAAVGSASVWFAFVFESDAYVNGAGAYVDNLVIRKVTAAASCAYSISPSSQAFGSAGGGGSVSVTVTAGSGCSWTASSNAPWVSITSGASGTGSGAVGYSVQANAGGARTGTITIAGRSFTVSQAAAACSYSITPTSASVAAGGGSGSFTMTAGAACAWTAASGTSWLRVTSGSSGSGSGTVSYVVDANPGGVRSATITAGGQAFAVNQAAAGAPMPYSHWLPAVIHKDVPSRNAWWRSDVAVLNRSSSAANLVVPGTHDLGNDGRHPSAGRQCAGAGNGRRGPARDHGGLGDAGGRVGPGHLPDRADLQPGGRDAHVRAGLRRAGTDRTAVGRSVGMAAAADAELVVPNQRRDRERGRHDARG